MIAIIKNFLQARIPASSEQPVAEAYNAWSAGYDYQPGNLMLDLDEQIFTSLVKNIDLNNKKVADIGCGTGRHWQKIYKSNPTLLTGFDVSQGMLDQLKLKFQGAAVTLITDNRLEMLADNCVDCIITTLTIAHIKNINEAIAAWARILKKDGHLLITDFHPAMLAKGGKRSFRHQGKSMSVINYVHPLNKVKMVLRNYGFSIVKQEERYVNEEVKHYYEAQHALPVYERFKGLPVIYGLLLKNTHAVE